VRGLRLDGASENGVAQAGIATWRRPMIDHLEVVAEDCDFVNFDSERFSAFVMHKSTFADTVSFTNCRFEDISGTAISLRAEVDDTGRYNAEHVTLRNCFFRNVMGSALDLYRGSNDESTTGPWLRVDHCTFVSVNNVELGSVLRLTGVQDGDVRNCLFVDSGRSGRAIKMEDQRWCLLEVSHINLTRSGRIESFYPDRRGPGLTELETRFANEAAGDFALAPDSPLVRRGSDGRDLGALWRGGVLTLPDAAPAGPPRG
jgi:poly(beta-D-mannuronate) lyase